VTQAWREPAPVGFVPSALLALASGEPRRPGRSGWIVAPLTLPLTLTLPLILTLTLTLTLTLPLTLPLILQPKPFR